jgi:PAS domain S-box-containing protein
LAASAAVAIENAQLYKQARQEIAERKRAEEALKEHSDRLEEMVAERTAQVYGQYAQLEAILQNVGDAILMSDSERQIAYVNPAYTALTGYTLEEIIGQPPSSVGAGAGSEQLRQTIISALEEGRAWRGEVVGRRKDGRPYDAELTTVPMYDAEGRLIGYVSSHRDISQSKALERARTQFMTNVSHQLRTPVTSIQLHAHLLRQEKEPGKTERLLQTIEEETNLLVHLIQDILDITQLDSGQTVIAWRAVSLPLLIEDATARYRSRAEASRLALEVTSIPSHLPQVKGDQIKLTKALEELVENAVTFTPPGGKVGVEAGTIEDQGRTWVTIAVQDAGPGVSPEEQEKVFDRFFRGSLAESGHVPGTGLGLSIAQEIVQAHGGRITVESEPEKGSTFTIWLPAAE